MEVPRRGDCGGDHTGSGGHRGGAPLQDQRRLVAEASLALARRRPQEEVLAAPVQRHLDLR